ncbi:MAG: hypothetical protein JWL91_380 [Sphingomonas bacterium]|nr:LysM domain-containing protein [Sphingomonas bacterium]MDB5688504.1 hypothetical protein [Sphingomonas bacterium]
MTSVSAHRRGSSALLFSLMALALASCGAPKGSSTKTSVPSRAGWAGREGVGTAIELLNKGESVRARKGLMKLLKKHPDDAIARGLLQQIDTDPVASLGAQSFAYTVRENDTLSSLAGRFLGDPMKFYALGRYNDLKFPAALTPGQLLRIPGAERVDTPKPKPAPRPRTPEPAAKAAPPPRPAASPTPVPPAAAKATADPARAARLRAAGLEQLNRGDVNRAIASLRQAQQAAPGNDLIARDISRATRIQRAVQTKKR